MVVPFFEFKYSERGWIALVNSPFVSPKTTMQSETQLGIVSQAALVSRRRHESLGTPLYYILLDWLRGKGQERISGKKQNAQAEFLSCAMSGPCVVFFVSSKTYLPPKGLLPFLRSIFTSRASRIPRRSLHTHYQYKQNRAQQPEYLKACKFSARVDSLFPGHSHRQRRITGTPSILSTIRVFLRDTYLYSHSFGCVQIALCYGIFCVNGWTGTVFRV